MKQQVFNPYLPSWEYVPDGEPHLFGNRVYVYGSHDRFGAPIFCVNDYVCWSAPADNLKEWRYEGVIYRKKQDPANWSGLRCLYAPDVTKGPDGRYYLYYAFDFLGRMGVAVCDTPAGKYKFYGYVKYADGHVWGTKNGEPFPFDPGVLTDEDGKVYLYSGFATKVPFLASRFHNLSNDGGVGMELEADMLTIKQEPRLLFPRKGKMNAYADHGFFEASSIRKVDGKYCFVYSSEHNHELCYAISDAPLGPFTFEGTLVDLGDLYLDGNRDESRAKNYLGNTHGGILEIDGQWYIFYHRQTNQSSYARQACAERLERNTDGKFCQSEVTSCGLNHGALLGKGRYDSYIACNLWSKHGTARYDGFFNRIRLYTHPYLTQTGRDREDSPDQYIANMRDGAVAGFKYFQMDGANNIKIEIWGNADGVMQVASEPEFSKIHAELPVNISKNQKRVISGRLMIENGIHPLYFRYVGTGKINFGWFELGKDDEENETVDKKSS